MDTNNDSSCMLPLCLDELLEDRGVLDDRGVLEDRGVFGFSVKTGVGIFFDVKLILLEFLDEFSLLFLLYRFSRKHKKVFFFLVKKIFKL